VEALPDFPLPDLRREEGEVSKSKRDERKVEEREGEKRGRVHYKLKVGRGEVGGVRE
jgi:hypothetical protein